MGLKKLCLTAGLVVVGSLFFAPGALAWTFSTSGSVTCDRNTGEHVITWSIDNRSEPEALTIRESNRGSVAVGSTAAARSIRLVTERIPGSTTGTITLTVKGNWPSDRVLRTRSASVTLSATCLPDICPNLTGVQDQLPSGMIKDTAGNCVPRDECPNIEGVQTTVPHHFHKDQNGNCVCEPHIVEVEKIVEKIVTVEKIVEVPKTVEVEKIVTVEKTVEVPGPERIVQVPGPERVVTVAAAPITVEKIVERVVRKVVIKRVKVKAKKAKKRKAQRPRVLPFTP